MSCQKGNTQRTRKTKHQNTTAFKNDMHNKTKKMQHINKTELPGLCQRCKEKIEWKIKYGKYKPLTVAHKCTKCSEKTVKQAYYTVCLPCGTSFEVCCKCGEKKDIVLQPGLSAAEQAAQDSRLEQELKYLTERQRRSFFRLQADGKLSGNLDEVKGQDLESEDVDSDEDVSDVDSDTDVQAAAPDMIDTQAAAVMEDNTT